MTRARLKQKTSVKIGIFMGLYSFIYSILFIWERSVSFQIILCSGSSILSILFQVFDPGEVLYIYESPAGYGLIILRLTGWIW